MDELNLQIDLGKINRTEFFKGLEKVTQMPSLEIKAEFDAEQRIPDQELIKLIKKLKTKYKIALLTNAGEEEINIIYRDKIANLFDVKTISYQVGSVKPNEKIYLNCLNELGVEPSEAYFIDDSTANLKVAKKLGIHTILYAEFGIIPLPLQKLV